LGAHQFEIGYDPAYTIIFTGGEQFESLKGIDTAYVEQYDSIITFNFGNAIPLSYKIYGLGNSFRDNSKFVIYGRELTQQLVETGDVKQLATFTKKTMSLDVNTDPNNE
jgi:hypothetical protein